MFDRHPPTLPAQRATCHVGGARSYLSRPRQTPNLCTWVANPWGIHQIHGCGNVLEALLFHSQTVGRFGTFSNIFQLWHHILAVPKQTTAELRSDRPDWTGPPAADCSRVRGLVFHRSFTGQKVTIF